MSGRQNLQHEKLRQKLWRDTARLLRELQDDRYLRPEFTQQAGMLALILERGGEPRTWGFMVLPGGRP